MKLLKFSELPDLASRPIWKELLGVSRQGLINAENNGKLKAHRRTGGSVWYTKQAIINYLDLTESEIQSFEKTNDRVLEVGLP